MLSKMNKILYSTDLSKSSAVGFEKAVYLAKETGAEIHILHVVEKLSNDEKIIFQSYVMDATSRDELLDKRVRFAEQKLIDKQNAFWQSLSKEDRKVRDLIASVRVVESYPAETILRVSQELDVDLIVMGSHEKGIVNTFLGSVAKKVLNRSRIPMLVVPLPALSE